MIKIFPKRVGLKIWRWSWLLTLPVCLFFGSWLYLTVDRYYTYFLRYRPIANLSVWHIGTMQFQHMLRSFTLATLYSGENDLDAFKQVNLYITAKEQAKLTERMPSSGFRYVEAGLAYEDKIHKVKFRYRGDHFYHWSGFKKSIRIKTKKENLYEGMRAFNLIIPKTNSLLNNYLAYRLAEILGLMTPKIDLVNVNLNDDRQGLHLLVEQLSEMTLRNHHRIPGDVYRGDHIGRAVYRGVSDNLFDNANLWEKITLNNHYPADHSNALTNLLVLLSEDDSRHKYEQLNKILDMDAFAKFSTFEALASSYHYDNNHNWHLYYDPAREKFEPVVWDPVGWHHAMMPTEDEKTFNEVIASELLRVLFKNGKFIKKRNQYLQNFFVSDQQQRFFSEMEKTVDLVAKAIVYDPNVKGLTADTYVHELGVIKKNILKTLSGLKQEYLKNTEFLYKKLSVSNIAINISGRHAIDKITIHYQQAVQKPERLLLRYIHDKQWIEHDLSFASYVEHNKLLLDISLLANMQTVIKGFRGHRVSRHNHIQIQPAYYELLIDWPNTDNQLIRLSAISKNESLNARQGENIKSTGIEGFYQFTEIRQKQPPAIWFGKVGINHIKEINREVIIRPGTQIVLHENASLIFNNKLTVEGNKEHPVRFMAASPDKPWGAVVIKGRKANGSQLQYCQFSGGSGLKGDLFEYSAMFSLHDTGRITVDNCIFSDNHRVDDMVHGVYTDIHFRNSEFRGAKSDALDLDISQGIIENSVFVDNGNDSLDLMDSNAIVINSKIFNSGDKGVSVGEATRLLAVNNLFMNNGIGLQSKDGSRALVLNNHFMDNIKALDAYKKNWRYNAGGYFHVSNNQFDNNESLITVDDESAVEIFGVELTQLVIHKNIQADLHNMEDDQLQGLLGSYYSEAMYLPYWELASDIRQDFGRE